MVLDMASDFPLIHLAKIASINILLIDLLMIDFKGHLLRNSMTVPPFLLVLQDKELPPIRTYK